MRRIMRVFGWLLTVMLIAGGLTLTLFAILTDPAPWTRPEVVELVSGLNEAAAIGVPHFFLMEASDRTTNAALLVKVEQGEELSADESIRYRKLFQTVLQYSQAFLGRFDRELTVLNGFGSEQQNNCLGNGIDGKHDHHDVSARLNFAGLLGSLAALDSADTFLGRIRHANAAYKDLADLISHLGVAPHTVSVPYTPPDIAWQDELLGASFETMMKNYKRAQFLPVNSRLYWQAVDEAQAAYVTLILAVQDRVVAKTSAWERKFAGRFMSPQTLAPPVDLERPVRPH